jgi:hypothetical protein
VVVDRDVELEFVVATEENVAGGAIRLAVIKNVVRLKKI